MPSFICLTNNAASIHRGYTERDWDALLSGDLKAALAVPGKFVDPATGEPFPDDAQSAIEAAIADARDAHATQARPPAGINATAGPPKANTGHGGLLDPEAAAFRHVGPRGDGSETSVHLSVAPNAPSLLRDIVSGLTK